MRQGLKLMWLVGGALLAPACAIDDTVDDTGTSRPTVLRASAGGEAEALRGVEVDPDTYAAIVVAVGEAPSGLGMIEAPAGTVRLLLSPASPLSAAYDGPPSAAPPLTIAFDDGTAEPVALILPAIQKVREAAAHGDGAGSRPAGTISLLLEGPTSIGRVPAGVPLEVDDRVATVMVRGALAPGATPQQRTAMAAAFDDESAAGDVRLIATEAGLGLGSLDVRDPYLMGRWSSAGATMNLVVDIRMDGPVLTRFRIARATPDAARGQGMKPRGHVKVFDGTKVIARDGNAERAMFDASYAAFDSDPIDAARRSMLSFGGATTMQDGLSRWVSTRSQMLAELVVASGAGGAPGYEALACAAALPTAVTVANTLDARASASASAMATVEEAATEMAPVAKLTVGGELALQRFGAAAPAGDAELACLAVREIAALPDAAATTDGQALRVLAAELDAFDARRLDILLTEWIVAMDAFIAAPDETGWTAARAKADILLELLADASEHSAARWSMAASLLGRTP